MSFKPYHYDHVNDLIRYYAAELNRPQIIQILDAGIQSEIDARAFCDFIPELLDARIADENAGKTTPVEIGSAVISDLHYEAGSFVCDAGYEPIWDAMIERL